MKGFAFVTGCRSWCRVAVILMVAGACAAPLTLQAAQKKGRFTVGDASTRVVDEVYRLDADIAIRLSKGAVDALQSGIPLVIEIQIQVLEVRSWMWDSVFAELIQRRQLQYHALSRRYLLKNLNTGVQQSFSELPDALRAMGTIRNLPMLDHRLLTLGKDYAVRMRVLLDTEALPVPMRLWVYVSSAWDTDTKWYEWPLPK